MRARVLVLAFLVLMLVGPAGPALGDEADVRSRLHETRLNLSADDQTFDEVVAMLRVQTGINVLVDPRIHSDVGEVPVTSLHAKDMRLTQVLDLLATAAGEETTWVVRGNTVVFTHRYLAQTPMEARLYPVAALVAGRTTFAADSRLLGGPPEETREELSYPLGRIDELVELVRGAVSPSFWEEREGADVRTLGDSVLLVRAEPQIHQEVHEFLVRLEDMEVQAVTVELRAVDAERLPEGLDAGAAALTDTQVEALLASSPGGPTLSLAVREDLPSTAFIGTRRAYIAGYDAAFAGETSMTDPRIDSIEEGMAVHVRALPAKPGGRILLKLDAAATGRATGDAVHGADSGEAINLPARNVVRRELALLLRPGRWHLAEGRLGGSDAGRWAFLVRATPAPVEHASPPPLTALAVPEVVVPPGVGPLEDKMVKGLHWEAANLDQVVAYLRTITGINFFVAPRVRAEVFEDVVVHLQLDDVSVRTVLDLVTEPYELEWSMAENLVTIDVGDPQYRKLDLRYFDVKDLTEPLESYTTPPSAASAPGDEKREPVPFVEAEALVELLRETVATYEEWEDPASIEARNRVLIVRQSPAILDTVAIFLAELRASRSVVALTVEHVEVEDAVGERLLGGGRAGAAPFVLDDETLAVLAAAIEGGEATRRSRERIVSVEGTAAPKTSGQEVSFVADYDLERSHDRKVRAPVRRVDTLLAGTRIDLRAIRGYAGDRAHLEIRFERNRLVSKAAAETPYGAIDLPVTEVWSVATGLSVPYKATAVVCASRTQGMWQLLLVTPHFVTPAE